jgi:hypothetical protein
MMATTFAFGMHPDAERQLRICTGVYGARFQQEVILWLRQVAFEAAKGNELGGGASASPVLDFVTSEELRTSLFAPNLFRTESFIDHLRALAYACRHFEPPYEYWVTEKYFPDVASSFDHTVKAFFIVDRVHRRVKYTAFLDLPGE